MGRVDPREFQALDLRCHTLLRDVPLHDAWAVTLPGGGPGRTMADVLALSPLRRPESANVFVRALFAIRRAVGACLGWDAPGHERPSDSYLHLLTDDDRARSSEPPGSRVGALRLLYVFPNEAVAEIRNATVHAFLAQALRPLEDGYILYWAIYVKPVSRLTAVYMAAIDPFRRFVVYPALLGEIRDAWSRGPAGRTVSTA